MQKKVLITGGSGLLAVNWALSIRDNYAVTLLLHHKKISLSGVDTDIVSLSSLDECLSVLAKHRPDIVIHTAGLTNVEECESNPDLAQEVNVDLAKNIAIACNKQGVKLVHISTDHLFSGDQKFSTEESVTNPVNNYAKTKLLGEQQVLENYKDAIVIRTNFFAWGTKYRQSFSDFILNKLKNNEQANLFSDVFFTPILVDELSKKTEQLINSNAIGLFNITSSEYISKYEFGVKLADCFNFDINLINKISINDRPNLVQRPKDMSLSNAKLCQILNCEIPSLDEQLQTLKEQDNHNSINQVVLQN
jgi:dTDP-4-dehydrorhamnose reductase